MKLEAAEKQTIREYLLGQLPGEEQSQFEERLLTHDEVFEELEIVEDELVDEYLSAELTEAERQSFESHFILGPEHREKLRFARALKKSLKTRVKSVVQETAQDTQTRGDDFSRQEPADGRAPSGKESWFEFFGIRNPLLGYATAVALVLVVVGVSWVVWRRATAPRDPGKVMSVLLTSGLTRDVSEGPRKILVTPDTDTLRLQLIIPESRYSSFEATLLDAEGSTLTTQPNLRTETVDGQTAAIFDVPASLVSPGDYRVKLDGAAADGNTAPISSYSFRVLN